MAKNDNLISANVLRVEKYSTSLRADLLLLDEGAETADIEQVAKALKPALENKRAIKLQILAPETVGMSGRKKRSLDANAYFWVLVGKIADKLRASKDEIYFEMLKKYGQSITVTVRAGLDLSRAGFKYYELFKDGISAGKPFEAYRVFIGSSQYDTREMSVLIDGVVQEAKELGIETLTPLELSEILGRYEQEQKEPKEPSK